uniref:Pentatricopeptide repeat-containing protein n=1 Tax=Chenopodium quinoa TaxID=63459 RepID=A0A803KMX3_CHEQI
MQSRGNCKPNLVIYNTIINSLCKDSLLQQPMDLFSAMKTKGIQPDVVTYNTLVRGFYNSGCREEAKGVLTEMLKSNIAPTVETYSMLVDMFCKDGNVKEAQATLQLMTHKGVTPNIFIHCLMACAKVHGWVRQWHYLQIWRTKVLSLLRYCHLQYPYGQLV